MRTFSASSKLKHPGEISKLKEKIWTANHLALPVVRHCLYISFPSTGLPQELAVPFTIEEDHWLKGRLEQAQELLWSVPIGEEVLRELLLFSIGVVPSRFFVSAICRVFVERIWRVLDAQTGENNVQPWR